MEAARELSIEILDPLCLRFGSSVGRWPMIRLVEAFPEILGGAVEIILFGLSGVALLLAIVKLWFGFGLRIGSTVDDRAIRTLHRSVPAVEIFLLNFVDEVLRFEEPRLEIAHFRQQRTKIRAEPLRKQRFILGVKALRIGFSDREFAHGALVIALGLFADGLAINDEQCP